MKHEFEAGLPGWLMVVLLFCAPVMVIAPGSPARFVVVLALWLVFFTSYIHVPERTLLVFILLMPVMDFLPASLHLMAGLNFQTLVIPLLALAAAKSTADLVGADARPKNPLRGPVLYFILFFWCSGVFSYLTGSAQLHSWAQGWYEIPAYEMFSNLKNVTLYTFLVFIAFMALRTPRHLRAATGLMAVAAAFVGAQALWSMKTEILSGQAGSANRAAGLIFDQPNLLGGFMALMISILVPLVLDPGTPWKQRIGFAITLMPISGGLLLSFSRAAWIAALAALLFVGGTRNARVGLVLVLLALTITMWIPQSVIDRVSYTFRKSESQFDSQVELEASAQGRVRQWKALPRMWLAAPLIGHGYNSFDRVYGEIRPSGTARAAHSAIIKITVEQGLAGLAGYFWLIWALARGALRLSRSAKDSFIVALSGGYVGALICLVVQDASGSHSYDSELMAYLWILGGGLARLSVAGEADAPAPARPVGTRTFVRAGRNTANVVGLRR